MGHAGCPQRPGTWQVSSRSAVLGRGRRLAGVVSPSYPLSQTPDASKEEGKKEIVKRYLVSFQTAVQGIHPFRILISRL